MDEIDAAQLSSAQEATMGDEETDCASRSERKRIREKQRRLDVRNAFEELSSVMAILDPGGMSTIIHNANDTNHAAAAAAAAATNNVNDTNINDTSNSHADRKKRKRPADQDSANRVEIIQQATQIMRRLHRENEEAKRLIAHLHQTRNPLPPRNDNVLVMVPTLALAEEHHPVAHAQYPAYFQHQMNNNNNNNSTNNHNNNSQASTTGGTNISAATNMATDGFRLHTNQPQHVPHHLHQPIHVFPQPGTANTVQIGNNRNDAWNRFSQQQQPIMHDNLQHLVHDNMSSSNSATSKDSHSLINHSQAGHPNNSTFF